MFAARFYAHGCFESRDGGVETRVRARQLVRHILNRRPTNALDVILKPEEQPMKARQVGHEMFDVRLVCRG